MVGSFVAVTAPWIKYAFAFLSSKPFESMDNLQLNAEHKKTIRRTELERSRADLFAGKEAELIERAKRDEEILSIDDAHLKERLQAEIVALRQERDRMSAGPAQKSPLEALTPVERTLLSRAAERGDGLIARNDYLDGRSFQIGFEKFGGESRRDFVRYESAMQSLVEKGLLSDVSHNGKRFELTSAGWDLAEAVVRSS